MYKKEKVISVDISFQAQLKKLPDQLILLNYFLINECKASRVYALCDCISLNIIILKNSEEFIF